MPTVISDRRRDENRGASGHVRPHRPTEVCCDLEHTVLIVDVFHREDVVPDQDGQVDGAASAVRTLAQRGVCDPADVKTVGGRRSQFDQPRLQRLAACVTTHEADLHQSVQGVSGAAARQYGCPSGVTMLQPPGGFTPSRHAWDALCRAHPPARILWQQPFSNRVRHCERDGSLGTDTEDRAYVSTRRFFSSSTTRLPRSTRSPRSD